MFKKLFLSAVLIGLVACQAGWDKNPKPDGLPPEVKQAPPVHMAAMRDAIFIHAQNFYDLVEGEEKTITFDVDVLQPDIASVEVVVDRLESTFPGATQSFDETTGQVTIHWEVPKVFVRGIDNNFAEYSMNIIVNTESLDGTLATREQPVQMRVLRSLARPEILEVKTSEEPAQEGRIATNHIEVLVRDPNLSSGRVTVGQPLLIVEPTTSTSEMSGAAYMRIGDPKQDTTDPELWKFNISIRNLPNELTNDKIDMHYLLRAYSPMAMANENLRSAAVEGKFQVVSTLGEVKWTGSDSELSLQENAINFFSVVFYEPKGEGLIEASAISCGSATCTCTTNRSSGEARCDVVWVPKSEHAGNQYAFVFEATVEHKTTKEKRPPVPFEQKVNVLRAVPN